MRNVFVFHRDDLAVIPGALTNSAQKAHPKLRMVSPARPALTQITDEECTMIPTLFFDVAVDCFFIVDIFVNFNTGIIEGLPLSSVLIPGCARQYEGLGT